jgi:hypothetical protein
MVKYKFIYVYKLYHEVNKVGFELNTWTSLVEKFMTTVKKIDFVFKFDTFSTVKIKDLDTT